MYTKLSANLSPVAGQFRNVKVNTGKRIRRQGKNGQIKMFIAKRHVK